MSTTYCTDDDLIQAFSQSQVERLSDPDDNGALDSARLAFHRQWAFAEINKHVQQAGYSLPLDTVPDYFRFYEATLARFNLFRHDMEGEDRKEVERIFAELKAIAEGRMRLGADDDDSLPRDEVGAGGILNAGPERIFTRESMRGL